MILRDPSGKSPNVSINRTEKPLAHKIRVHLDLYADDQKAEVERLVRLGATVVQRPGKGHDYVIMADPEGNHFCVVDTGGRHFTSTPQSGVRRNALFAFDSVSHRETNT